VRFRLKKDLVRKLEAAAKRNDQSLNEEVADRLRDSFEFENWREERERLALLFRAIKEPSPQLQEISEELDVSSERYFQAKLSGIVEQKEERPKRK
jgi:hypothetical protein